MKAIYNDKQKGLCLIQEMPEEPKDVKCFSMNACNCATSAMRNKLVRSIVDEYDDNCPHRYKEKLEAAIKSAIPFKDQDAVRFFLIAKYWTNKNNFVITPGSIYPIEGELRYEIELCKGLCMNKKCYDTAECHEQFVILLPEESKEVGITDAIIQGKSNSVELETKEELADWEVLAEKSLDEIHKHTLLCSNEDEEHIFYVAFHAGLNYNSQLSSKEESQEELWDSLIEEWEEVSMNMQSPHILPYLKSKFHITRKINPVNK